MISEHHLPADADEASGRDYAFFRTRRFKICFLAMWYVSPTLYRRLSPLSFFTRTIDSLPWSAGLTVTA